VCGCCCCYVMKKEMKAKTDEINASENGDNSLITKSEMRCDMRCMI
jgi:hypothetical protein